MPATATAPKKPNTKLTTTEKKTILANKAATKKPAEKKTTSAAKKAVEKVAAEVKAKAAAPKKPATKATPAKPAAKPKVETPATPEKPALAELAGQVKDKLLEETPTPTIDEKPNLKVESPDLTENISRLKGFLKGNRIQDSKAALDQLEDIIKDLKDAEGNLLIEIKPKRGERKTKSKENGVSALRREWAKLIDEGGATREELLKKAQEVSPDLLGHTVRGQMSLLRRGINGKAQNEYAGRFAKEVNGMFVWAEEPQPSRVSEDKGKIAGPIEMIGSDGRVWAGRKWVS